jgi:serine/threonine protein kinase/beta-lactam-binding protein with PASTA domain
MNDQMKNDAGERVLSGRYRIIRPLASGGMARVFLAEDLRLQRQVAVKVIHPHLAEDVSFIDKFRREAVMAAGLNHPNLVNIFDQGNDAGAPYLVMEYVSGRTLREVLSEFGSLPANRALQTIEAILGGLAAAHQAGILHRDIKPENVLLADDGRIKLSDFGLARPVSANTETESVIGTAAYLSPELVTRGQTDERSDVYAIGILLYELLTGKQPFTGEHAAQVAALHANSAVGAPSLVKPEIPELVDEIVLYATERNPQDRPRDASELLQIVRKARAELKLGNTGASGISKKPGADANATTVLPASANATTAMSLPGASSTEVISNATEVIGSAFSADEQPEPLAEFASKNRLAKWLIASLLAMLVGASAGWWFGAGPGALRAIPNLEDRQVSLATKGLEDLGFEVSVKNEYSKKIEQGLVSRTDPAAGTLLAAGSKVSLFVSLGAELKVVPKLNGLDVASATAKILAAGFTFGGAEAWFDAQPVGIVFDYTGADGAKQPVGSAVNIKLSLGPLPAVANIPQDVAVGLLTEAGLKVSDVSTQYSETVAAGNVINLIPQSQPLGTGGSVKLVVSKGTEKVVMPRVVGETIAAAQSLLQSLGLVVVIDTNKLQSQYGIFKVKKVSVAPGTTLRKGDSVTIISR